MRIMIVDDDTTTLLICRGLLEDQYEVDLMKSGLQAMGSLMEQPDRLPDLILLDIMMPGTSGMETLISIRKNATLAHIPVLFLSELGDDRTQLEGYRNGADGYIKKPITPDLLRFQVERQLEINKQRQEYLALKEKLSRIQAILEEKA